MKRVHVSLPLILLLAGASGCAHDDPTTSNTVAAVESGAMTHVIATANTARSAYLALNNVAYRRAVFELLRELSEAVPSERYARLVTLVDVARAGGLDGLEALLVAHADGVAGTEFEEQAASLLAEARDEIHHHAAMPLNILQPLGRASTRLVIDVRPDAARALYSHVTRMPASTSLNGALQNRNVQEDLCSLPPAETIPDASQDLLDTEAERKKMCDEIASGRAAAAAMIGIGAHACTNLDLFDTSDEGDYTASERFRDLDQCIGGLSTATGRPRSSFLAASGSGVIWDLILSSGDSGAIEAAIEAAGGVTTEAIKQHGELLKALVDKGGDMAKLALQAYIDFLKEQRDIKQALDQMILDSKITQAGLDVEIEQLSSEISRLSDEIKSIDDQIEDFDANGMIKKADGTYTNQHPESGKTKEQLEKEKEEKKKEKEAKEKAQQEKKAEKDKEKAKQELLEQERKKVEGGLEPGSSEACDRAMTNGLTNVERRLGEEWTSFESRLSRYINPDPTDDPPPSDSPAGALGLPRCGEDVHSTTLMCNEVTDCPDETACGCPSTISPTVPTEEEVAALLPVGGLCDAVDCGEGDPSLVGSVCMCVGSQSDDGRGPPPPPISAGLVDTLFEQVSPSSEGLPWEGNALDEVVNAIVRP